MTFKVGVTGGIACGKTTVTQLFSQKGVPIIDADVISHELVQPGQPALQQIIATFGHHLLNEEGCLNRPKLRQQIFAHPEQRQQLEAILHPLIKHHMLERASKVTFAYCILSIPLLIEKQQHALVDRILVVDCSPDTQKKRLQQRDQSDSIEIERILSAQVERQERLKAAHDVIDNEVNLKELEHQVDELHQHYLRKAISISNV